MTQWVCFRKKKKTKKRMRKGRRNLHLSPIGRDGIDESQRIAMLWGRVASFVLRKEWYICQFTPNFWHIS